MIAMSDLISAIQDDIEEYEWLCNYFNEKPKTSRNRNGVKIIDPYGNHADKLKERWKKRTVQAPIQSRAKRGK